MVEKQHFRSSPSNNMLLYGLITLLGGTRGLRSPCFLTMKDIHTVIYWSLHIIEKAVLLRHGFIINHYMGTPEWAGTCL